ncbi:hypothetical protein K6Y31_03365 [Motilimonas cestriensis]|uniref:Uncharacterized protein n=1 Tax=Motilimonas cestriensis TaxID=2742685 RepID=A0ABS8W4G2_9GAMM|nr:hypothetical protein [Motilimonas cestriensis]MCE2593849.1 hypothetical protein [Motilimonas cestriensis]
MQIFNQLPPKKVLPISIAEKLMDELNPSNDIAETQANWAEISCHLLILDEWDKPNSLSCLSDSVLRKLLHTLDYPEYVDDIGRYTLSLGISGDDGSGLFLLCYQSINLNQLKEVLSESKRL